MSRWRTLGVAVLVVAAGCSSSAPGHPSIALTPVDVQHLDVGLPLDQAFRLPAGVRSWPYGAVTDGRYLVFGIEAPDAAGRVPDAAHPPVQSAGRPGRYGVVDLARRRLTVRNTLAKGAHSDYVTLVHHGARTDLVRVEAVEQPATKCPAAAGSCFAWQVTAEQLPSGSARVIARSRAPAASTDVPQPVSNGSVVAWLDVAVHGRAQVIRWHPGSAPRPLGPPVATGLLSLGATDAWVGTPFGQAVLTRLPLDGRAPSRVELPPGAALATVGDSLVAYRVDRADGTRSVCVAAVERAVSCRVVFRAPDIYLLGWLGGDLLVSSPAGYGLVDPRTASATPTTLNYLYLVHALAGRIAVLLDAGDHQVLAVGRSPA